MGKLKLYNLESEWLNDKSTHDDSTISYVLDSKEAKFQENGGYFKAIYNVTSTTSSTTLIGSSDHLNNIKTMFIDGEELLSPVTSFTFNTLGTHRVTCVMRGGEVSYKFLFSGCTNVIDIDVTKLNTSKVTNMRYMFSECSGLTSLDLSNFDTSNVTDMSYMFFKCSGLTSIDVSNFNTSNVTDMCGMFRNCKSLTSIDVSNFNTSNVTDMNGMFNRCSGLTSLDVSNFENNISSALNSRMTGFISDTNIKYFKYFKSVYIPWGVSYELLGNNVEHVDFSATDFSQVENFNYLLRGCSKLTKITWNSDQDSFPSNLYSTMGMFWGCSRLTSIDISWMNTSKVTNMSYMFHICNSLKVLNLGHMDVSKVTNISNMCSDCTNLGHLVYFKQTPNTAVTIGTSSGLNCPNVFSIDFSKWDASNVTNMSGLCSGCSAVSMVAFSETMNTSNVTDMNSMFYGCRKLTAMDLTPLNTSAVTNMDNMFYNCTGLTSVKLSNDVSKVTSASSMFYNISTSGKLFYNSANSYTTVTNTKPSNWTAVDINCDPEFTGTYSGNSGGTATPIFGSEFDLSQVKEVYINDTKQSTVASAYTFSSSSSNTVRCVLYADKFTDASFMFNGCGTITALNVDKLDTSKVTDMSYMFYGCSGLTSASTLDISSFNTSNVTDMNNMFHFMSGDIRFPQNFGSQVTDMSYMFVGNSSTPPSRNINLGTFNTQKVENFSHFIYDAKTLSSVTINYLNTSAATDMSAMFAIINVVTSNYNLTSLNTKYFDTSNVTDMSNMFECCNKLTSLDLSNFDTSKVTNMSGMFQDCNFSSTTQIMGFENFNTSNVTDMSDMFGNCSSLTSLDVSHFDTSNVTSMYGMFYSCSGLTSLNLSNFNTSKVTDMSGMFSGCTAIASVDLSNFNTSKVTDMNGMFYNCKSLTLVTFGSQADVSKVTSYGYMFNSITTTGTLYYPSAYADSWNYLLVTNQSSTNFPSTWTAVAI